MNKSEKRAVVSELLELGRELEGWGMNKVHIRVTQLVGKRSEGDAVKVLDREMTVAEFLDKYLSTPRKE